MGIVHKTSVAAAARAPGLSRFRAFCISCFIVGGTDQKVLDLSHQHLHGGRWVAEMLWSSAREAGDEGKQLYISIKTLLFTLYFFWWGDK